MSTYGDEHLRETLDQIFRNDGQSYEQFMNGFLFLRREDVTGTSDTEINSLENADTNQVNGNGHYPLTNGINGFVSHENISNPSTDNYRVEDSKEERRLSGSSDHSLSEEDIGPGNHAPSFLTRTSETTGGTVVQLDNFVDDEGSPLSDLSPVDSEDDTESPYTFSGHIRHPSQTGTQSHSSYAVTSHSPVHEEYSSIFTERKTNRERTLVDNDRPILTNSEQNNEINPRDIREDLTASNNSSEGEPCTPENSFSCVKPLPGEVDSDEFKGEVLSPITTNVRHLSIKTTFRECPEMDSGNVTTHQEIETEYCEVEPFSIDEDFDYDNVILTPKFNFMNSHLDRKETK